MSRLSIRVKLLIVFMLLFTIVLAGSFYWFYRFTTGGAMNELRSSLMTSAGTAAGMIDPDELMQVYATGAEDDPQYTHIAEQLRIVRDANLKIGAIYTMVRSSNPNELLFVVSADEDPETRAPLRDPYDTTAAPEMIRAFDGPIADPTMGADEWGVWLSGYAPIRDASGAGVAIVGVDMRAEDVVRLQNQIRNASILVFLLSYIGVFAAVFLISGAITHPLLRIAGAAGLVERGALFEPEQLAGVARSSDEVGQLARVFSRMAVQVQERERQLKQQVEQLRIEVDDEKRARQVAAITESDYFQDLQAKAKEMRGKE
jgi:methyl-accepting chemotaxis protein